MSDPLLKILNLCLLALLYLFFARVLQAVWAEVAGPRVAKTRARAAKAAPAHRQKRRRAQPAPISMLRIVEPETDRGHTFPLADEMTLGRAAGCQITLEDTFVSQIHARIFRRDGQFFVEDLGSTNGTYLNRVRVAGPMVMSPGDLVQVGSVVMELA